MNTGTYTPSGTEPLIDRLRRAVIGRYDVYAELGAGGMASVFLALDLALERKVAIKVMSPALANSADNVERFKREAKVAAALNHPNIIGILAVGDDPELAYFVMKYVEGRSLDSVIRDEGPQPVALVQSVIAAAGKALYYAHTRGVIHRDVKPANFMLDRDGWLVVTDFGIAKQADMKGLTMTGSLIGTPYYMSPEQYHGKPVSPAADQYALGIVAYELLTGTQPYTGDTVAEVMRGHLFDPVPNVRDVRPEVPAELEACVGRMMAKEPEQRFATLEEAVIAFGAISPTQEVAVRTQIIELAKIGAMRQPELKVPLSPVPLQRPPVTRGATGAPDPGSMAATTPIPPARPAPPRTTAAAPAAAPVAAPVAAKAPRRSRAPLFVGLALVVGGVLAAPTVLTSLQRSRAAAEIAPTEAALPAEALAPVDSAVLRDSLERVRLATVAAADSVARADSTTRADSIARAEAAVQATAQATATARADSLARATRRAAAAAAIRANTPARTGAPVAPRFRVRKDGTRVSVPPSATPGAAGRRRP
ncbi:MAG: serine/threonine protein kinase [Gemmatimonadetes bacterium]|nr:serine/threonine protein kinase [Gemmatimonadota bacterium]